MKQNGRPAHQDTQYHLWLNDMAPFLKSGCSLHFAIEKAGLLAHKDSIYRKHRLNDWFCEKIALFQSYLGELTNVIAFQEIEKMHERVIRGESLTSQDVKIWKLVVTRHRSCQPFFVSYREISRGSSGKSLEKLAVFDE